MAIKIYGASGSKSTDTLLRLKESSSGGVTVVVVNEYGVEMPFGSIATISTDGILLHINFDGDDVIGIDCGKDSKIKLIS